MARLIVKSPYIKCGAGKSPVRLSAVHRNDGSGWRSSRMTARPHESRSSSSQSWQKIFLSTKTLLEYEDYKAHPTKQTPPRSSPWRWRNNWEQVQPADGYMKYIATRPSAERLGDHGLFGDGDRVDLDAVHGRTGSLHRQCVDPHHLLHREDAERLGYDNAQAWRTLLRAHRNDIAAAMNIPPQDFRWYAAFHDEGTIPTST